MIGQLFSLLGKDAIKEGAKAIGNFVDELHLSDQEKEEIKLQVNKEAREAEEKESQRQEKTDDRQHQQNMQDSKKEGVYHSGWRPALGWLCVVNLAYIIIIRDFMIHYGMNVPQLQEYHIDFIFYLTTAILGIGGSFRSWEKMKGLRK